MGGWPAAVALVATIENNDQFQPHFAQLHVTQIFYPIVKVSCPNYFSYACQGAPRCAFGDFELHAVAQNEAGTGHYFL